MCIDRFRRLEASAQPKTTTQQSPESHRIEAKKDTFRFFTNTPFTKAHNKQN